MKKTIDDCLINKTCRVMIISTMRIPVVVNQLLKKKKKIFQHPAITNALASV